tara:strand:+ start:3233 stop:3577 length:345 start_codon:yes stop_codon:yes gene_type:complete
LSGSFNITDGTNGHDLTTGLTREKLASGDNTILTASDYTATGESQLAYVFIKNFSSNVTSTVFTDAVAIKVGTAILGYLAGGQSIILPYSADNDLKLAADTADTVVEYQLVHLK